MLIFVEQFEFTQTARMKETIALANHLFSLKLNGFRSCIRQSNLVKEIMNRHKSNRPFHLNVIEAACCGSFKETGHSRVLADMLRFPAIQSSFLKTFLGLSTDEVLSVTNETDRVDVALQGKDIFVIIENKVNGAIEQKSQVYRYVHEIGMGIHKKDLSQIYVVYLNPTNRTPPSKYSLCDENGENDVFDALGKGYWRVRSYKNDITDWLRKISKDRLIQSEPHIHSALDQYIDYLEQKFHTSLLDKEMNNEINNLLLQELQIENKSLAEQLDALKDQQDKANELLAAIDTLIKTLKDEDSHNLMREWQKQIEQNGIALNPDDHSFGVQLKNNVWLGIMDGSDSWKHVPYWGFKYESNMKDAMPELYQDVKGILNLANIKPDPEEDSDWIAWGYSKDGVHQFLSLYNSAKQLGLL